MKTIGIVFALLLSACSKDYSFDTTEDARRQAKENALQNALQYRIDNKLADYDVYSRGDSTITNSCPQGDGWASNDLIRKSDNAKVKLKCSTTSTALGCVEENDFKSKAYAQEEGSCAPLTRVPFPIRKLSQ